MTVATVASGLLLAACGKDDAVGQAQAASAPAQKREVGVVTVSPERLVLTSELPGRTSPRLVAEIRPQVGGIVQKRLFEEGAMVKAGQVLYQLDAAPYEATLNSARAALRKAEATVAVARSTAQRNAELVKIDAISQQVNEESQATLQQAEADVGIARATMDNARINLGYTRITAPISGQVGLSTVTPGALVTANQATALTTVQQLDPINVDVTQSSTELLRLKREVASGALQRGGDANEARIHLVLEDGTDYPHEGQLAFSGVNVDEGTGAITLRAVVPNPDGLLMPGMYVRAQVAEGVKDQAMLVPQQAVTRQSNGTAWLLAVGADEKVVRRNVGVDRAVGNRWLITEGVQPGERVIVEGGQRVRAGDAVQAVAVTSRAPTEAASGSKPAASAVPGAAASATSAATAAGPSNRAAGARADTVTASR